MLPLLTAEGVVFASFSHREGGGGKAADGAGLKLLVGTDGILHIVHGRLDGHILYADVEYGLWQSDATGISGPDELTLRIVELMSCIMGTMEGDGTPVGRQRVVVVRDVGSIVGEQFVVARLANGQALILGHLVVLLQVVS